MLTYAMHVHLQVLMPAFTLIIGRGKGYKYQGAVHM